MSFLDLRRQFQTWREGLIADWRLYQLTRQVIDNSHPNSGQKPVVFFNVSSRIKGLSLNAAFTLLTACGLQISGVPVVYFACQAGMSQCVLGTKQDDHTKSPPCKECVNQSRKLLAHAPVVWFSYSHDDHLAEVLRDLNVEQLSNFEYIFNKSSADLKRSNRDSLIPLGKLVIPSLRWALRRHNLPDDEATRHLFRGYILSAHHLGRKFSEFLDQVDPVAVVIFNGIMYPEAVAQWVAELKGIRTITHEVGFQPFSAFFSEGQATAYPMHIPKKFELSKEQNERLDSYLEERFQGEFTMAGIRFWPKMSGLDDEFDRRIKDFHQLVSVFTNVVYDTSQVHANVTFPHMFSWLNLILEIIRAHPETHFVIRAHPDEMRPGTKKQSRESVHDWINHNGVTSIPNVTFIDSQEYLSSYELIKRSKFVMVYNSSVGLEAALMGALVLCGGKARYTQYPIVLFPDSQLAYRQMAEQLLSPSAIVAPPPEFIINARRFMYYQLFKASLSFSGYLENHSRPGYVRLGSFSWRQLCSENSTTMRVLVDGILHGKPFLLDDA